MEVLAEIIFLIIVTAPATADSCMSKNGSTVSCYAASGKPVFMHFNVSFNNRTSQLIKDTIKVLAIKSNEPKFYGSYEKRCEHFSNNTVKLKNVVSSDSGEYFFETYDSDGKKIYEVRIQLKIQEPLSEPVLSQHCLPHGEMRVSCSPQGEYTELKWTLDNQALDGNVSYLSNQVDIVILKAHVSGALRCEARNHVSNSSHSIQIVPCPGPDSTVTLWCTLSNGTKVSVTINATHSWSVQEITEIFISFQESEMSPLAHHPLSEIYLCIPAVIVSLSAALAVLVPLVLLVGIYYVCCRHHKPPSGQQPDHQDVPELCYAQVSVKRKNKSSAESQLQEGVQYGQIKIKQNHPVSDTSQISLYTMVEQ
ncbi:hypothetical protein GN956_G160 [Arapaima gigas]